VYRRCKAFRYHRRPRVMDSEVLSLLCDPDTRYSFELEGNTLRNTATGRVYPVRDGIPLFVSTVTGSNLKSQTYYDRMAPFYDLQERLYRLVAGKRDVRREFLNELEIGKGDRVLEVSVGTGANLRFMPRDIEFFGIDLSWGMLQKCRRNLRKWRRDAHLFQCEAERLPFRAEVFDCVFHIVGVNFFNDKVRAIKEMIWVARPGAKIVIVEEIDRQQRYPIDAIPEGMQDLKMREIGGGRFYCITFRKPFELVAAQRPRVSEGSAVRSVGANSRAM
jgi:ubiquinone/menaquinone biosynthesis C-methylase UbiE/uncharacterized protein YbaR (Trm112 family)